MPKPRGLPKNARMRHDEHFIEALTSDRGVPIGRMVAIEQLEPNPDQPRKEFDDLEDLINSVKEKGVLAPVLVRKLGSERYQIIAGERRYRASLDAGLTQVPIIEMEVDERGVLELSLIENLQRRDLASFEETDGVAVLSERYGYTHEMIARKLGKSRSTITELLALAKIPPEVRKKCRHADIVAKSMLLEIGKCPDPETMLRMVASIHQGGLRRDEARALKKDRAAKPGRPRPFVFRFQPEDRSFRLQLKFRKSEVDRSELVATLKELVRSLESGDDVGLPLG